MYFNLTHSFDSNLYNKILPSLPEDTEPHNVVTRYLKEMVNLDKFLYFWTHFTVLHLMYITLDKL